MIVNSTYTEGPIQSDGRRYVKETHTDDLGQQYDYEWLGSQDPEPVIAARVAILNNLIQEQLAVEELVAGTILPLTPLQFRELFTFGERTLIDELHETYTKHPALTAEQKATLRTALKDYEKAQNIRRPFDDRVAQMLGLYQALGFLTAERVTEIMAVGNG